MKKSWRNLTIAALLGAMAYLLMYIAIPIIPIVPYMTLDFSGIPILLAFLIFGRKDGYVALLIKELLHLILAGMAISNLIGVLADAIALIVFIEIFNYFSKAGTQHYVRAIALATLGMTVIMAAANYWVITPLYIKVLGMKITILLVKMVLLGVVPFNLIKGIVIGGLTTLLVPKLRKVLTVAR